MSSDPSRHPMITIRKEPFNHSILVWDILNNCNRGVINGKAGKAVALPKLLDALTLSQPGGGADYTTH